MKDAFERRNRSDRARSRSWKRGRKNGRRKAWKRTRWVLHLSIMRNQRAARERDSVLFKKVPQMRNKDDPRIETIWTTRLRKFQHR